ncbi:MAG TPA: class I SAM-dependent methyltransferase [Mycobacteriales bacterium]|jgi:SAM-dependent methyltransferase
MADAYLGVELSTETLDRWLARTSIEAALRRELPNVRGTVLDVGCGHQPYRSLLLERAERVVGVDIPSERYGGHDVAWDGVRLPVADASVDQVLLTEVLEHCPDAAAVVREAVRVLRPGGRLFFTVPFLWPLHDSPYDEQRFTPFALDRILRDAGLTDVAITAMGGWDASLAQMVALWVRRRPMGGRKRRLLSRLAVPVVRALVKRDRPPAEFKDRVMFPGLSGTAVKP